MNHTTNLMCPTPQMWVYHSRLYHTNSGIFFSKGASLLIDPGIFPDEIDTVSQALAEHSLTPFAILLTHSHWDHILGPERFPGVTVIAQDNFSPEGSAGESAIRQSISRAWTDAGLPKARRFNIPVPDLVFNESMTLTVGTEQIRLVAAPGHSRDQCIGYHSASQTLWAADMLSDLEIPYVSYNLAAYRRTLDFLADLEIAHLIPGHGTPTSESAEIQERLRADRGYLAWLGETIQQAVQEGCSLAETLARAGTVDIRRPDINAEPHRLNVETVFAEFGGDAGPGPVGWRKVE